MSDALRDRVTAQGARDAELAARAGRERPWIYVSGPMSGVAGDLGPWQNVRGGLLVGRALWLAGWHPVVPHLNAVWEMTAGQLEPGHADGASGWLELDFSWMTRVDAVWRRPGYSGGGNREILLARARHIPVFYEDGPGGEVIGEIPRAASTMWLLDGDYGSHNWALTDGGNVSKWSAPRTPDQDPWATGVELRVRAPKED